MTRPEPQRPPDYTLRHKTGTPLPGGTTGAGQARVTGGEPAGEGDAGQAGSLPPLLPPGGRRPAAVAIGCCAVLVAVLAGFAAGRSQGSAIDRPIDAWLRHHLASHLHLLSDIAYLGGGQVGAVLTAVLVLACLAGRRVNGALLTLVSVVVAVGLTEFALKPLVHETINGSLTYPSGHTTSLFTLIAVVGVLMLNPPRQRPRAGARVLLMAVLVAIGALVAVAVIALDYHYFTDTIAGVAFGSAVAFAAALLLDVAPIRRWQAAASPRWLKPRPSA